MTLLFGLQQDSSRLLQQLQSTQSALAAMKENSYKQEYESMRARLAKMTPIVLPRKNQYPTPQTTATPGEEKADPTKAVDDESSLPQLQTLMRRCHSLKAQINTELVSPQVIRLEKKRSTAAEATVAELMARRARTQRLVAEAEALQLEVAHLR